MISYPGVPNSVAYLVNRKGRVYSIRDLVDLDISSSPSATLSLEDGFGDVGNDVVDTRRQRELSDDTLRRPS